MSTTVRILDADKAALNRIQARRAESGPRPTLQQVLHDIIQSAEAWHPMNEAEAATLLSKVAFDGPPGGDVDADSY